MKLTFFSDTHQKHSKLLFTKGDILIFCGDMTRKGHINEVRHFAEFVSTLDYKVKVVIAGNHDLCFENRWKNESEKILQDHGIDYLNNSGISIEKFNIWGAPTHSEERANWSFYCSEDEIAERHWEKIPKNTHLLMTHIPPRGILDRCYHGGHAGCPHLYAKVREIRPLIHAFGHIHENFGRLEEEGILFLNASSKGAGHHTFNPLIEVNLD